MSATCRSAPNAFDLVVCLEVLEHVPDGFKLDPEFRVTPVDYGDVCLNYDVAYSKITTWRCRTVCRR
jgi:thiamine transport system substrate-binding protein